MKRLLLLACLLLTLPCAAKETVKLCFDNEDAYPSTLKNGTGYSFLLLNTVADRLDVNIIYHPLPWKRCLKEVQSGNYDGVIGIAYLPERRVIAAYPLNSKAEPLHEQRLLTTTRSVYRRKDSSNDWDGKQFSPLNGSVGVQAGYMAASVLKQRQIPSEDSSQSVDDLFRKLSVGLIQIAVAEERQGDRSLKTHPEYAKEIEKLPQPFLISDLFLAFSYSFQNKKTTLSQAIWQNIAIVRESSQFKNTTQE
ncbi:substrate-binding periplasmic protein [Iodobacter fluviatilis]|uniref:Bacterial extracellular solute-binding proteins, family 3 n=1 Tax=Iodobacter fluviatilis TaxID=537 RepID=A0A377QA69_9NEIS|nr:transporter substrate-binding domain-containing protein [Iodobacter fluviatilis]TCU83670.1 polar amino acid transport system substrate-binding protein [Iodobacter fluviatilis]STQ91823.1 Bacterial extracellular solute-binding proteins, family 3 [Iodobacter fluviatilis]